MRVCVRTDDGERSEWFDVTQKDLLVNVFAAVIHAVLVRFSEDPYIF